MEASAVWNQLVANLHSWQWRRRNPDTTFPPRRIAPRTRSIIVALASRGEMYRCWCGSLEQTFDLACCYRLEAVAEGF